MTMKMKAINFHKRADYGLAQLSAITGLTIAEMVRKATDNYLYEEFAKLNRPIPELKETE